jgi:hypothetical protein
MAAGLAGPGVLPGNNAADTVMVTAIGKPVCGCLYIHTNNKINNKQNSERMSSSIKISNHSAASSLTSV